MHYNVFKTISQNENPDYVARHFINRPGGTSPRFPPEFPMTCSKNVISCFLYLIYQNNIIGYGKIAAMNVSDSIMVGSFKKAVKQKTSFVIDGPMQKMPFKINARGFTGIRYTTTDIHSVTIEEAIKAMIAAGVQNVYAL